jgi:hypothetical protein
MRDLPQKSLLGLDSMAITRSYLEWFSESTGFAQVVLGTCQRRVIHTEATLRSIADAQEAV